MATFGGESIWNLPAGKPVDIDLNSDSSDNGDDMCSPVPAPSFHAGTPALLTATNKAASAINVGYSVGCEMHEQELQSFDSQHDNHWATVLVANTEGTIPCFSDLSADDFDGTESGDLPDDGFEDTPHPPLGYRYYGNSPTETMTMSDMVDQGGDGDAAAGPQPEEGHDSVESSMMSDVADSEIESPSVPPYGSPTHLPSASDGEGEDEGDIALPAEADTNPEPEEDHHLNTTCCVSGSKSGHCAECTVIGRCMRCNRRLRTEKH